MRSKPQDNGGFRVVHGQTTSAGAVFIPGSADWTCTKTATGVYIVRFPAFRTIPTVTALIATFNVPYLIDTEVDMVQINTYVISSAGTAADGAFMFRIEGRPL